MIAEPVTLCGQVVRLEPLRREHITPLYRIATATPELFRYTSTPVTEAQRDAYFDKAFQQRDAGLAYPFTLFSQATDEVIGTSRFADYRADNRNCELGYTWLSPACQGTAANVESKLLMLTHAFEVLELLRIEIHSDSRNERSQAPIRALGATYEGTLRSHQVMKDGYVRDTVVFSIIHSEWDRVKAHLQERLDAKLSGGA